MRISPALLAAAAGMAFATSAYTQELPRWNADQTCSREGDARAFCAAFERQAYSQLSGIWSTLQPNVRSTCVAQTSSFGQNSYRLLEGCIEDILTAQRVQYRRKASGFDDVDPAKPDTVEIKSRTEPQPIAAEPAPDATAQPRAQPETPPAEMPKPQ